VFKLRMKARGGFAKSNSSTSGSSLLRLNPSKESVAEPGDRLVRIFCGAAEPVD
jgi:hypothetical protein